MKKLRLEMDALRVESFATAAGAREAGTVHGHSYPNGCFPPPGSDPFVDTCHYATCAGDTAGTAAAAAAAAAAARPGASRRNPPATPTASRTRRASTAASRPPADAAANPTFHRS